MKKTTFILGATLILSVLILISCQDDNEVDDFNYLVARYSLLNSSDYFPLQLGNYWEIDGRNVKSIDGEENLSGTNYYRMIFDEKYGGKDAVYFRKTPDGKIYEKTRSGDEQLKFDLNAEVGSTWTFQLFGSDYPPHDVTLESKSDTVILHNYVFTDCYRFRFDILPMADDELTVYLAPGIGVLKESCFCPGSGLLNKVNIDGVELQFYYSPTTTSDSGNDE